ncbi:MAG: alkaline phosphatase [Vicinamibacterales bacterium]
MTAGAVAAAATPSHVFGQAPGIVAAPGSRPVVTDGVASSLVDETTGLVWARTDRAARLHVDWATTERFDDPRTVSGPVALDGSDYTARAYLTGLPPGQRVFYRVRFQDLADLGRSSEPVVGSLATAPAGVAGRDVSLVFSADTVGQGWGIDPAHGGFQTYAAMLGVEPDLFVNLGDAIYADQPVGLAVPLDGGGIWRSQPSPAKAKVAETLAEFRGNYRYNLTDHHMRRFNARVAQLATWDDHEVRDNWYLERRQDRDPRYAVASVALLAARAAQAHFEYTPMPLDGRDPERRYRSIRYGPIEVFVLDYRSYRGANSANRQADAGPATAHLGERQVRWLEAALAASPATWKVMASSLPIGLVVGDGPDRFEAVANGDPGPPLGRELETARLLRFIHERRIDNVVWITGDVHYAAAHHYDPARARVTDFTPFWEFVAGPLHAGTFGPNPLDPTFGPEVRFLGIPPGMKPNRPPSEGYQFFGRLVAEAATGALRASLHERSGREIFATTLAPAGRG